VCHLCAVIGNCAHQCTTGPNLQIAGITCTHTSIMLFQDWNWQLKVHWNSSFQHLTHLTNKNPHNVDQKRLERGTCRSS